MRIRVMTEPPLAPLKAWFVLPSALLGDSGSTISTLKIALCDGLRALAGCAPAQLMLTIDGFELLAESALDVLRADEVVWCVASNISIMLTALRAASDG